MYKDKVLEAKTKRRWYLEHKEAHILRAAERRRITREYVIAYKRTLVCTDCGMSFREYPECCDFHHLEDKDMHIAEIDTMRKLLIELDKCIPLCANCHRIRHAYSSME